MRIPPWAEEEEERYRSQCVLPRQGRIINKDMGNMEQQTRFDEEFKIITKEGGWRRGQGSNEQVTFQRGGTLIKPIAD